MDLFKDGDDGHRVDGRDQGREEQRVQQPGGAGAKYSCQGNKASSIKVTLPSSKNNLKTIEESYKNPKTTF